MLQWQQCCIIKLTRPSVPIPSLRPRHTSLRFHTRPAPNTTPPPSSVHPPLSIHSTRVSASSCQARRSGQSSGMAGPRRASPFLWGAKLQGRRKKERVLEGGGMCSYTQHKHTHTEQWCHLKWHHPMENSQQIWWVSILQWVKAREQETE